MKKKAPEQEIMELSQGIRKEIDRWEDINQNGCSDPFWPDGMNLNLVRNHIIYAKRTIAKICEEHEISVPEEMHIPIPPKVNQYYMANLKQKSRVERIGNREKITTKRNRYDRNQLSLF